MHEIVTLCTGNYSSFIQSHFFNIQEASFSYDPSFQPEVDHDVMFQEHSTIEGKPAYTPRLVLFDLRRNFRTLRLENSLFNPRRDHVPNPSELAAARIEKHEAKPYAKNQFLKALEAEEQEAMMEVEEEEQYQPPPKVYTLGDADVSQWSDYLGVYLHPRSLNMINDFGFGLETKFDNFPFGETFFSGAENFDQYFEGSFRYFVEGCDNLQGFHAVTDIHDSFGGFASALLAAVREEFPKKPILTFGAQPPKGPEISKHDNERNVLNEAFSLANLHTSSSIYVPFVAPSSVHSPLLPYYSPSSKYHSSALLGAFLENASLPYRQKKSPSLLVDLVSQLSWRNGSRIADATLIFPLPTQKGGKLEDIFASPALLEACTFELSGQLKLTPPYQAQTENLVLSGCTTLPLFHNTQPKEDLARYRKCKTAKELFIEYLKDTPRASTIAHEVKQALHIPKSFPPFFSNTLDKDGQQFSSLYQHDPTATIESAPALSLLRNSDTIKPKISTLLSSLKAIRSKAHSAFANKDAIEEITEDLEELLSSFD